MKLTLEEATVFTALMDEITLHSNLPNLTEKGLRVLYKMKLQAAKKVLPDLCEESIMKDEKRFEEFCLNYKKNAT